MGESHATNLQARVATSGIQEVVISDNVIKGGNQEVAISDKEVYSSTEVCRYWIPDT